MNVLLLAELERAIMHIEHVTNGQESGDVETLFQELLDHAAAAAGRDSPEYGLALRSHASYYRNRGERARAVEEYTRALALLEYAGEELLIQVVQTLASLAQLHRQLLQHVEADKAVHQAIKLTEEYICDPDRYTPPAPLGQALLNHEVGDNDTSLPLSSEIVGMLAQEVAASFPSGNLKESLSVFDELGKSADGKPDLHLAILLAQAAFERANGSPTMKTTYARAWELAHESPGADDYPLSGQWAQLGSLSLNCDRPLDALEAARRIRELERVGPGAQVLSNRHAALQLEASAWAASNDLNVAEQALRRLVDFCASSFGRDDWRTVDAETMLGRFLIDQDRSDEAVDILKHAAATTVANPTYSNEQLAGHLLNLAVCLDRNGQHAEAMQTYLMAYMAYISVSGPSHPDAILSAHGLAETARIIHDYETAERWFRIVLHDERDARGHRTERMAHALNNLAETLAATGSVEEAAPLAEQALTIRSELFGKKSDKYSRSLAVVAQIALKRGDRERFDAAMAEFMAGSSSGTLRLSWELAVEYLKLRGRYEEAIKTCEQAIAQLDRTGQREKSTLVPDQKIALRFTHAELLALLNRWAEAMQYLLQAFDMEVNVLSEEAGHLSQRQLRLMLDESRGRIARLLDVLTRDPHAASDDIRAVYKIIQQRKGIETRLLSLQKRSFISDRFLTSVSPDQLEKVRARVEELVDKLHTTRERWHAELLHQAQRGQPDPQSPSILALQYEVERLECVLASYVGDGSRAFLFSVISDVPVVSEDQAVIEYIFTEMPVPTYYAFVVTHETIHFVPLGNATSIHQALMRLRTLIVNAPPQSEDPDPAWQRRARFLFNRLLKPLLPFLGNAERLYVVPDSELFTLPFDLLPLEDGGLAIDRWTITHLWNGGELTTFNVTLGHPAMPGQPLVVSAPSFAEQDAPSKWRFAALPFADQEGDAIASRIGAIHLRGPAATKQAVGDLANAEIIHFATHSFYIARAQGDTPPPPTEPDTLLFRARSALADPMERSGIALAGANLELNAPTTSSRGILYASEILDLDLRNTDLTVLSSCQSGIGDHHPGDGIQGLRRAFRAAGVSTVVSSLWKVPDEATHDFMLAFYDRLVNQIPRGQAFREAKLALRKRFGNDPLFWAGFVLDGSDQPLFRFSPVRGLKFANLSGIGLSFDLAMENITNERWDEAIELLELVLHSRTADNKLRSQAAYERAGVLRRVGQLEEALAAYDILIGDLRTPYKTQREAVGDRALTRLLLDDLEGAYLDYTAFLASADITNDAKALALLNRGVVLSKRNNPKMAIVDWSNVLSDPSCQLELRLMALFNRADEYYRLEMYLDAIADATALVKMPESEGSPERSTAYLILARCHLKQGEPSLAMNAVRRHFEERVPPAPPGAQEELAACKTTEQLAVLVESLF